MTANDFAGWVNSTLLSKARETHPNLPNITNRTAVRWLHILGFDIMSSKKGVYIDGHERNDVVDYRKIYLRRLEIISSCHAPPLACEEETTECIFGPQRTIYPSGYNYLVRNRYSNAQAGCCRKIIHDRFFN